MNDQKDLESKSHCTKKQNVKSADEFYVLKKEFRPRGHIINIILEII